MFNFKKKPVSVSAVRTAAELVSEMPSDTGSALVTVHKPEAPKSDSGGEAVAIARLQSMMAMAAEGQEKLCIGLIAQGKSEFEVAIALNADLKAQNAELKSQLAAKAAEPAKPEVSKEEVVAELLKKYQNAAPQIPPTASQGEPNVYEKYQSISDPVERRAFYDAHEKEINAFSITDKTNNKEGE